MINKHELKDLVNKMADAVENTGTMLGIGEGAGNAAKCELAMFMMYISASDGEIKWDEASMISDLCDLNLTPQTISDFIREKNIYSTEFERKVPVTLQMVVQMDNKLMEMNMTDKIPDMSEIIIGTYKTIATILMNSDNDVDENEESDCQIYLNTLETYVNNNSLRRKTTVLGFAKNTGSVSAPTKSGVSAPKKKG